MPPSLSVYHEDWYLDAATDGQWGEARVVEGGTLVGRMPYALDKCAGFTVSRMPSLIRTLGPEIAALPGKEATVLRRRIEITHALIQQLPDVADFHQVFDPRITDVIAFMQGGFGINVGYTFWMEGGRTEDELWKNMMDTPRNRVRKAASQFSVAPTEDVNEFCDFYERNLGGQPNFHGPERMRRVLRAVLAHERGSLLMARTATGQPVASIGLVWGGSAVRNLLISRSPDHAQSSATVLMMWEGMRLAARLGLGFDFDGVTSPGMLDFLSRFGGKLLQRLRVRRSTPAFRAVRAAASLVGQKDYFDGIARSSTQRRKSIDPEFA